jgi:hypothetical protein
LSIRSISSPALLFRTAPRTVQIQMRRRRSSARCRRCLIRVTCPIHYFRSKTHVWGGFALYPCRTSPIPKTGVGVHTKHEFLPPEPFRRFLQRTCQIHYFRSKSHVRVVSRNFIAARHPFRKRVSGCIQSMSFRHRNHFFVFRNEHAQTLL